jgi:glycosyltransferase involved in cell wall biosynthesis
MQLKKKVLFLSAWYPTRIDPMPGLFVQQHAKAISDICDVSVLHCIAQEDVKKNYEIDVSDEFNLLTIRVYYKKSKGRIPLFRELIKVIRFERAYTMGYRRMVTLFGHPDIVHANILTRVGAVALYLKIRYGIPYVITEHWSRYLPERNGYKGVLRKMITRIVVGQSEAISTVSQKTKSAMMDCGISHRNFMVINNLVDCDLFRPQTIISEPGKKIFSHVSCFDDDSKNISGILRVLRRIASRRDDFLCILVGDGKDWEKIEQSAHDLVLKNNVQFTGMIEGSKLVEVYNKSMFTVLFSNYENMPVVISESFACGKPVIATKTGGIPEFVNEKNGILIEPRDEQNLEKEIDFMLDNSNSFISNEIREYAIKQFGKETVGRQLKMLYGQA